MSTEIDLRQLKQSSNPRNTFNALLQKLAGTDEKMNDQQRSTLLKCLVTNIIAFSCILFGAIVAYYASQSNSKTPKRYYTYMFFIIVPVIVGVALSVQLFSATNKATTAVFLTLSLIIVVLISVYFLAFNTQNEFVNLVSKYAIILIGLAILAIGYRIFIKYLKNLPGWVGFIVNFLFYIPCLVLELFETIATSVYTANTPLLKISIVIFALLVAAMVGWILYTAYFYIRKYVAPKLGLHKFMAVPSSVALVTQPLTLSKHTIIGTNDVMKVGTNSPKTGIINPVLYSNPDAGYNRNYSIACWISISAIGLPNTPILCYGHDDGSKIGKPSIVTSAGTDPKKPFVLYFTNKYTNINDALFGFNMPLQKWNYLVITYEDNRVSFYLNGEIVFSRAITEKSAKIPVYDAEDIIVAGSDHGKIHGSICNVTYHSTPLSLRDITTTYALLHNKKIPTNYL